MKHIIKTYSFHKLSSSAIWLALQFKFTSTTSILMEIHIYGNMWSPSFMLLLWRLAKILSRWAKLCRDCSCDKTKWNCTNQLVVSSCIGNKNEIVSHQNISKEKSIQCGYYHTVTLRPSCVFCTFLCIIVQHQRHRFLWFNTAFQKHQIILRNTT